MTEKRYFLGYEDDFFRWVNDSLLKKDYVIKIGFGESDDLQKIVDLLNQLSEENEKLKKDGMSYYLNETLVEDIKTLLVVLAFCEFPKTNRLSTDEFSAIARLQGFLCENIIDLDKLKKECKK